MTSTRTSPLCCRGPRPGTTSQCKRADGFTLIELVVVILIIGILAAIAYPSYISYITRSNRTAAEACLSNYANYMERYYATNLSYAQDTSATPVPMNTAALQALGFNCATPQNTGANYTYSFAQGYPTTSAYILQATPTGAQLTRDTACGTLTLDQAGTQKSSTGASNCW